MKLGVFTVLFAQKSLEEALDYIVDAGLEAVEIGTSNFPGDAHCPMKELLESRKRLHEFKANITGRGLIISALSCHGNPVHPNPAITREHHKNYEDTVRLAEKLGVKVVNCFSGCPGDSERSKYPNWVVCPWPPDFSEVVRWQWEEKVIPYWQKMGKFGRDHGVRFAFEMHPGFVVYNPETLIKLRKAVGGTVIGANFDPSHLFWQGMDPIACLKALKGAVYHVHAKDCYIDPGNTAVGGVLDTKSYTDEINRSWIFRTVGYGHGLDFWKEFVSTLRLIGYDHVLSIEHEDSLMSVNEGFRKAVKFLQGVLFTEKPGEVWWA